MSKRPKKRLKDGGAIVHVSPRTAAVAFDGASLDDWTDEELLRGRRKNKNGNFTGRPPRFVPIEFHRELTRRRMQRATAILAYSLVDAATMLRSVVNDDEALASDRIRAAEIMFDRILGRPRESVALAVTSSGEEPLWQRVIANAVVGSEEQAAQVIEGEIVEGELVEDRPNPEPRRVPDRERRSKAHRAPRRRRASVRS